MKYIKKIGAILLSIGLLIAMMDSTALAANGSVTLSAKSGTVGSTVTVNGTAKSSSGAIGALEATFQYDPSALQFITTAGTNGGSGSIRYAGEGDGSSKSISFTLKFKVLKAGSHKVSTTYVEMYNMNEESLSVTKGSVTITGKDPSSNTGTSNTGNSNSTTSNANQDSNNKLKSLDVNPGSLSPAFDANTLNYSIIVPLDTKELAVSAVAQSEKATVSVTGGKNLKAGKNEARVTVIAENGAPMTYNLTITCGEAPKVQIGDEEYVLNEDFSDGDIPGGFERTQITYGEREYEAIENKAKTLQLFNLRGEEGDAFYIYNPETQAFYEFVLITIAEDKYMVPLPLNEEITEFTNSEIIKLTLKEKEFDAWKLDEEFSVIYAMNQDGEKVYYRYDNVDGVFQRYTDVKPQETEPVETKKTAFPNAYYKYAILGLSVLVLILTGLVIYFATTSKKRRDARKAKIHKRLEKKKRRTEKIQTKNEG